MAEVDSLEEVAKRKAESYQSVQALFRSANAISIAHFLAEMNERVRTRIIEIALAEMEREGWGPPPASFAWLGMGSAGRKAQTFRTDQDNGIIFEPVAEADEPGVAKWFLHFAGKVVHGLEGCGFALCKGNIMASNPDLCRSLDRWRELFHHIIVHSDPESLLKISIYFDFRCLYGDQSLVDRLWESTLQEIDGNEVFFQNMADSLFAASRPPVRGAKWRLYPKFGMIPPPIDIKREALAPLVAAVRLLALAHGISETHTLTRLDRCERKGVITRSMSGSARSAFDYVMGLRLENELVDKDADHDEHTLDLNALNPLQVQFLKDALGVIYDLQDYVFDRVGGVRSSWSLA